MSQIILEGSTLTERINSMTSLVDTGIHSPDEFIITIQELVDEAITTNDVDSEIKATSLKAWQIYLQGKHEQSTSLYQQLIDRCNCEGRKEYLPKLYLAIARMHGTEQRDGQALEYIALSQDIAKEFDDKDIIAEGNLLKGITLAKSQQYALALEAYNDAARYSSQTHNIRRMGAIFFLIASLHHHCENYQDAYEACEHAIKHFSDADNKRGKLLSVIKLAGILSSLKRGTEAIALLDENEASIHNMNLPFLACGFYSIKADILIEMSDIEQASIYAKVVEGYTEITNNPRDLVSLYFLYIQIYIKKKDTVNAREYLQKMLVVTQKNNDKHWQMKINKLEAEICELEGKYKEALSQYLLYHEQEKHLSKELTDERLAMIKVSHELIEKENEKELYRLRSEKLQLELVNKSTHLASESEAVTRIRTEILQILSQPEDATTVLRSIKKKMRELPTSNVNWDEYDEHFNDAHPDFQKKLLEQYPILSQTELKICTLLKVGLTSREIANMLALSIRSVENHRFRIRKKLDISDQNIAQMLNAV